MSDHVLGSEWVGHAQSALRIIPPFTVHDKTVTVPARWQRYSDDPDAISAFLHRDALSLPVSEVPNQQNTHRARSGETKCLLISRSCLHCHKITVFPELESCKSQRRYDHAQLCFMAWRSEFGLRKALYTH